MFNIGIYWNILYYSFINICILLKIKWILLKIKWILLKIKMDFIKNKNGFY